MLNKNASTLFYSLLILILPLLALMAVTSVWGYGVGISTHPLDVGHSAISTEFIGVLSEGRGLGMQARFLHQANEKVSFDLGTGFSSNNHPHRVFAGADLELFPDYENQPKISIRGMVEGAQEFGSWRNLIGVAPMASKGFDVWGREVYPFVALPLNLLLNTANQSYNIRSDLSFGATGKIDVTEQEELIINAEANINITNGFSAIFAGVSYPLK